MPFQNDRFNDAFYAPIVEETDFNSGQIKEAMKYNEDPIYCPLFDEEKSQKKLLDEFKESDQFPKFHSQYMSIIWRLGLKFNEFGITKRDPFSGMDYLSQLTSNLFFIPLDNFFGERKISLFSIAKKNLESLLILLDDPRIQQDTKKNVLMNLQEGIIVCADGIVENIVDATASLLAHHGLMAKINLLKKRLIEHYALIFFQKEGHNPGNEIHYVAAYYNLVATQYGLALRDDQFTQLAGITSEKAQQFTQLLSKEFTPQRFILAFLTEMTEEFNAIYTEIERIYSQEAEIELTADSSVFNSIMTVIDAFNKKYHPLFAKKPELKLSYQYFLEEQEGNLEEQEGNYVSRYRLLPDVNLYCAMLIEAFSATFLTETEASMLMPVIAEKANKTAIFSLGYLWIREGKALYKCTLKELIEQFGFDEDETLRRHFYDVLNQMLEEINITQISQASLSIGQVWLLLRVCSLKELVQRNHYNIIKILFDPSWHPSDDTPSDTVAEIKLKGLHSYDVLSKKFTPQRFVLAFLTEMTEEFNAVYAEVERIYSQESEIELAADSPVFNSIMTVIDAFNKKYHSLFAKKPELKLSYQSFLKEQEGNYVSRYQLLPKDVNLYCVMLIEALSATFLTETEASVLMPVIAEKANKTAIFSLGYLWIREGKALYKCTLKELIEQFGFDEDETLRRHFYDVLNQMLEEINITQISQASLSIGQVWSLLQGFSLKELVQRNHYNIIELLLDPSWHPSDDTPSDTVAEIKLKGLHDLPKKRRLKMIARLLEQGHLTTDQLLFRSKKILIPKQSDEEHTNLLFWLVASRKRDLLKQIIEYGVITQDMLRVVNEYNENLVFLLAQWGFFDLIERLLEKNIITDVAQVNMVSESSMFFGMNCVYQFMLESKMSLFIDFLNRDLIDVEMMEASFKDKEIKNESILWHLTTLDEWDLIEKLLDKKLLTSPQFLVHSYASELASQYGNALCQLILSEHPKALTIIEKCFNQGLRFDANVIGQTILTEEEAGKNALYLFAENRQFHFIRLLMKQKSLERSHFLVKAFEGPTQGKNVIDLLSEANQTELLQLLLQNKVIFEEDLPKSQLPSKRKSEESEQLDVKRRKPETNYFFPSLEDYEDMSSDEDEPNPASSSASYSKQNNA